MLSDDARTFLRYNFSRDDADNAMNHDVMDEVVRRGRPAIEAALDIFIAQYAEEFPSMEPIAENVKANREEAVKYAAGILGMM